MAKDGASIRWLELARAAHNAGQLATSVRLYEDALEVGEGHERSAMVMVELSGVHSDAGCISLAIEAIETALRAMAAHPNRQASLGLLYEGQGNSETAARNIRSALIHERNEKWLARLFRIEAESNCPLGANEFYLKNLAGARKIFGTPLHGAAAFALSGIGMSDAAAQVFELAWRSAPSEQPAREQDLACCVAPSALDRKLAPFGRASQPKSP